MQINTHAGIIKRKYHVGFYENVDVSSIITDQHKVSGMNLNVNQLEEASDNFLLGFTG